MEIQYPKNISNFFVAGINYKKSDATLRGQFAINNDQYASILDKASQQGLNELFIISTCNRTEIYGFAYNSQQLINLLCSETTGSAEKFTDSAYILNGQLAIQHLYEVGAGLDSQILGDYEIVGQIKTAAKFAKDRGFMGAFTERLINSVLQASKQVKNNTGLSGGTVSVSFAAVQYIRKTVENAASKNILLLGVGKIGRNTGKNVVDYLETKNVTLINRSPEKAAELAKELGVKCAPIEHLAEEIAKADIILVATNSTQPIILSEHLHGKGDKLILDLSIPYNVEDSAQELPNITMVNVDDIARLKDETLKQRIAEIPKAKMIINELMVEFEEWCEMRRHVPLLKELKTKLHQLHAKKQHVNPLPQKMIDIQIQRVLNETAGKIKLKNTRGCHYISALHEFIS